MGILFWEFNRRYLMLFVGTVGPHVICAQKTHLNVVVDGPCICQTLPL